MPLHSWSIGWSDNLLDIQKGYQEMYRARIYVLQKVHSKSQNEEASQTRVKYRYETEIVRAEKEITVCELDFEPG